MSTKQTRTVSIAPAATCPFSASRSRLPAIWRPFLRYWSSARWCKPDQKKGPARCRTRLPSVSCIAIGRAGLLHGVDVVLEDRDYPGIALALRRDFVPERERRLLDLRPFVVGNPGQLELADLGAVLRLAPPVPVLPIIVGAVDAQVEQRLQVLGYFVPPIGVHKVRPGPGARHRIG